MNIGIVTNWLERGAAYVSKAYLETIRQQHHVFIYGRGAEKQAIGDSNWDAEYVTWAEEHPERVPSYIDWPDFRTWVRRCNLDMVIFNEQRSWEVLCRLKAESNLLVGAYIDYYTPETVPFFALYDFLLCSTQRHYRVFQDNPQSYYIPWGADLDLYTYTANPITARPVTFFHSCGMNPHRKGTELAVRAFHQVSGDAKLLIHSQLPLVRKYPTIAALAAADQRIEVIEEEISAPGLYHRGDVYVYPSRLDGLGLTVAEALASGLPVITTDVAPMNEFVRDRENGYLVGIAATQVREDGYYWPETTCALPSLTEAMQYYVDHRAEVPTFRQRARDYAVEHLNWRHNSAPLQEILPQIEQIRLKTPDAVVRDAMRFERAWYRGRPLGERFKDYLVMLGARRLKRSIERFVHGNTGK